MTTIKSNKIETLKENYNQYINNCEDTITFSEYIEREAENDPSFFPWLFDDETLESHEDLNEEQENTYNDFMAPFEQMSEYSHQISTFENCQINVTSVEEVEDGVFVLFDFGNGFGQSAAVVYRTGEVLTPIDWHGERPESVKDIENFKWMDLGSHEHGVMMNGLPALF